MTKGLVDNKTVKAIVRVLKTTHGYDFEDYALESLKRRVDRIMEMHHFTSLEQLELKIFSDKVFAEYIVKEITVNTTEMFRDPAVWKTLREDILPTICKNDKVRIWHAACSSGEEVYSMAILLKELGLYDKVSLIASDINVDVIETAKKGIYKRFNFETHKQNYINSGGTRDFNSYFKSMNEQSMAIDLDLIKNVDFRKHDLVNGNVFSKFDLILCRNVLIYFNLGLQDKVIEKFNQSLFSNGFLVVGSKETIAWCQNAKLYKTYNIQDKIYKKVGSSQL